MEHRTFHGEITTAGLAQALLAEFNRGNLRAQQVGQGDQIMVQIATRAEARTGGKTGLTVSIQRIGDGVTVALGQQEWFGTAASLAQTGLSALLNPWSLLGRLDDLAQDISSLALSEQIWAAIERHARAVGAAKEIAERLRTVACPNCNTANPVGAPRCVACGAPLGSVQPLACPNCGNVMPAGSKFCSNCGAPLRPASSEAVSPQA
jgi:RNA polymerase subunit RPABC4/transcription elongation factor Spt4